jgi:hypothetical protein
VARKQRPGCSAEARSSGEGNDPVKTVEVSSLKAGLLADLLADRVLLPVQGFLLLLRNVTAVLARHSVFFPANLVIFSVQLMRLRLAHVPFLDFLMDAFVLIREAVVDLITTRVILVPVRFGERVHCGTGHEGRHDGRQDQSYRMLDHASFLQMVI